MGAGHPFSTNNGIRSLTRPVPGVLLRTDPSSHTISNFKWRPLTRAKLLPATETLFFYNLITFNVLTLHVYGRVAIDQRN